jgi:hypothetical protein
MRFKLESDLTDLAAKLKSDIDRLKARADQEAKNIAVMTHAFIAAKAKNELNSFQQQAYLGKNEENLKYSKLGEGVYMIELDSSAAFIEDGSPKKFMKWLLENNPKAKTAKDGSRYAHIPFSHSKSNSTKNVNDPKSAFYDIVSKRLKEENIDLNKIEKNTDGTPKLGIIHKINTNSIIASEKNRANFSSPRSQEMAEKIGLKPHSGIHKLEGLFVTQRKDKGGKIVKEAVTIRTISSKHEAEGRWYYPQIKPFNGMQAGYEFAKAQMEEAVKRLHEEFGKN